MAEQLIVAELRAFEPGHTISFERVWKPIGDKQAILFVVEGHVARCVRIGNSTFVELLGVGDVLCPWSVADGTMADEEQLIVVTDTKLALLDDQVLGQVARWPAIIVSLLRRACERSRRLGIQLAATHMVGVESRLLAVLWQFAHRWGCVNRQGVWLPLPLTNDTLGKIVGSSVPTISTAVNALRRQGVAARSPNEGWLLTGEPPVEG